MLKSWECFYHPKSCPGLSPDTLMELGPRLAYCTLYLPLGKCSLLGPEQFKNWTQQAVPSPLALSDFRLAWSVLNIFWVLSSRNYFMQEIFKWKRNRPFYNCGLLLFLFVCLFSYFVNRNVLEIKLWEKIHATLKLGHFQTSDYYGKNFIDNWLCQLFTSLL